MKLTTTQPDHVVIAALGSEGWHYRDVLASFGHIPPELTEDGDDIDDGLFITPAGVDAARAWLEANATRGYVEGDL